jgi:hypothetical protein
MRKFTAFVVAAVLGLSLFACSKSEQFVATEEINTFFNIYDALCAKFENAKIGHFELEARQTESEETVQGAISTLNSSVSFAFVAENGVFSAFKAESNLELTGAELPYSDLTEFLSGDGKFYSIADGGDKTELEAVPQVADYVSFLPQLKKEWSKSAGVVIAPGGGGEYRLVVDGAKFKAGSASYQNPFVLFEGSNTVTMQDFTIILTTDANGELVKFSMTQIQYEKNDKAENKKTRTVTVEISKYANVEVDVSGLD